MSRIINHEDHRILMLLPKGAAAHVYVFEFGQLADRFTGAQIDQINRDGRLPDEKAGGVWVDMVRAAKHCERLVRQADRQREAGL